MFTNSFSFEGRIRRTEYGLSFLILVLFRTFLGLFIGESVSSFQQAYFLYFILSLPIFWFFLAQGSKRCHDIGISGWFQLFPLMPLILIFTPGADGQNKFGENPKLKLSNF